MPANTLKKNNEVSNKPLLAALQATGYKFHTPKFEIDVSSLPDGHYTLRLSSGKNVGTKAFVKQR